jgi:chemotaxis protein methyltransferase CheR
MAAPPPGVVNSAPCPALDLGALARIAGLAPSSVLEGRLERAATLRAACQHAPEDHDHPAWAALLDVVTVQETRLFRHPAQCAGLAAVLPVRAAAARAQGRPLRLLSAGCASGEEAFTLACLAIEACAHGQPVEVVGLDLCRPALERASAGTLGDVLGEPLALVPGPMRRWLEAPSGHAAPHPRLRAMARFGRANLAGRLPPAELSGGAPFDVVFCRNVLIYLTDARREELLRQLRAALHPGGILGLGPTDRHPAGMLDLGENLLQAGHV